MGKELEHIDALFRDKLKNYREPTSNEAWGKLSALLDEKEKTSTKDNTKNLGRWGLLSLITLSFVFVFPGHNSSQIIAKKPKITISDSKQKPLLNKELEEVAKQPKTSSTSIKPNLEESKKEINSQKTEILIQEKTIETNQPVPLSNDIETSQLSTMEITIEKKPVVPLFRKPTRARGAKGIKVEITIEDTKNKKQPKASAPQTKRTINSIFRKLRKFSEASKRN